MIGKTEQKQQFSKFFVPLQKEHLKRIGAGEIVQFSFYTKWKKIPILSVFLGKEDKLKPFRNNHDDFHNPFFKISYNKTEMVKK